MKGEYAAGRRQAGVALVTALLVVALVSVAAVSMATRQQIDIRRTGNLLHSEQAYAYALGAESWARVILERDAVESKIDTLEEDWATQVPVSFVEGGSIAGRIVDLQGRFNLNNLVVDGAVAPDAVEQYKRLLEILELESALADPLVDWLDEDIDVRFPDGAEDTYYLLLTPAYRTGNRPMADISELRLVKGYDQKVIQALRPHVAALPLNTPLNINTAGVEVLATVAAEMSIGDGENLVETRQGNDGAFKDVNNFLAQPELAGRNVNPALLGIESSWFLFVSEANVGQGRARLASLVQRSAQSARVVGRQRVFDEPIEVAEPAEE